MGDQHCHILRRFVNGRAELHYYTPRSARERHDAVPPAAHVLGLVRHCDSGIAGLRRAAFGGNSAAAGSESGYEFLCPFSCCERHGDGAQRRVAAAVAAPVLVLRSS